LRADYLCMSNLCMANLPRSYLTKNFKWLVISLQRSTTFATKVLILKGWRLGRIAQKKCKHCLGLATIKMATATTSMKIRQSSNMLKSYGWKLINALKCQTQGWSTKLRLKGLYARKKNKRWTRLCLQSGRLELSFAS
jgi:hypothetical protein